MRHYTNTDHHRSDGYPIPRTIGTPVPIPAPQLVDRSPGAMSAPGGLPNARVLLDPTPNTPIIHNNTNGRQPARVPATLITRPGSVTITKPQQDYCSSLTPPITRAPETILLPVPPFNPYLFLKNETIDLIARERDIMLEGNRDRKATMLHELDNILPEWRDDIRKKNNITFRQLTGIKLLYFAALNGLDMTKMSLGSNTDILAFVEIIILARASINKDVLRSIILNTNRQVLGAIVVYMGLAQELAGLVPLSQLQNAIIHNNINNINQEQLKQQLARRNFLVTHKYTRQLSMLYSPNTWDQAVTLPIHPMERIITEIDSYTDDQILNTFGIIVPLSYVGRVRTYILENIVSYASVLLRNNLNIVPHSSLLFMSHDKTRQYFSELTDKEIFLHHSTYVPYNSRAELVTNTAELVFSSAFFLPCPPSKELSINKSTTISMTEFDETDQFFIAFGKLGNYYTYEITELIGAFHRNDSGVINFRRPENTIMTFTLEQAKDLDKLLKCFNPAPNIIELRERIKVGIEEYEERTVTDTAILTEFHRFPDNYRQDIRKFLYDIFYIGMYMRRWKGPGHPYPTKQGDTTIKQDPNDLVTDLLIATKNFLTGINQTITMFCMRLKVCEYHDGHIECGNKEFSKEWHDVLNSKRCIRQASTMYIGTAYHYLVVLFHERIPDLNVKQVDLIM